MTENLNQWHFVIAAYAVGVIGTQTLVGLVWTAMRHAEKRRDDARGIGAGGK